MIANALIGLQNHLKRHPAVTEYTLAALILCVLIFAAFGSSIQYDFAWDDQGLIVHNENIKGDDALSQALAGSFWDLGNHEDTSRTFYRPIITLSYVINHRISGLQPFAYHLTNLFLHLACSICVFGLARNILRSGVIALLAAALFATHPSHVENVVWISGRTDLFSGLFLATAIWLYLNWADSDKRTIRQALLIVTLFTFSLLSKETGVVLIPVLVAHYILIGRKKISITTFAGIMGGLLLSAVMYFRLRQIALGSLGLDLDVVDLKSVLLTIPFVVRCYMGILFGMMSTDPHHDDIPLERPNLEWWILDLPCCLVLALLFFLAWKHQRLILALCIAWIPLTLAPTFHFGSFGDVIRADRFLYIPSIGFAMGIARVAALTWQSDSRLMRTLIAFASTAAIVLSIQGSRETSPRWRDDVSLFGYGVKTSPKSFMMHYNHAHSLHKAGMRDAAIRSYNRTITLRPTHVEAHIGLAELMIESADFAGALSALTRAEELTQAGPTRGVDFASMSARELKWYKLSQNTHANEQDHRMTQIHHYRAKVFLEQKRWREAIYWFRKSLEYGETYQAHNNLAILYINVENFDAARIHLQKASALSNTPDIPMHRAGLHVLEKDFPSALRELQQLTPSELPESSRVVYHYHCAMAYDGLQRRDEALQHASQALKLMERHPERRSIKPALERILNQPEADHTP